MKKLFNPATKFDHSELKTANASHSSVVCRAPSLSTEAPPANTMCRNCTVLQPTEQSRVKWAITFTMAGNKGCCCLVHSWKDKIGVYVHIQLSGQNGPYKERINGQFRLLQNASLHTELLMVSKVFDTNKKPVLHFSYFNLQMHLKT